MTNSLRLLGGGSLALVATLFSLAETPPNNLGKKVANFTLTAPLDRATVSLADFRDKKAIVVVFAGTECPLNNLFLTRLGELHKEYGPKGVQFLAINSNCQDTMERIAVHAKQHQISFPVLKDPGNKVANLFGARRTPEAFVLNPEFVIRYQGRIDDQFGIDIQRSKPTRRDLAEALDDVLAGKEVRQPTTPVAGCLIGRISQPKADGTVTYTKHVAPILQKNCQECHRPGQIGPMALLSYDDVSAWSATIREVVSEARMPPWYADPRHSQFANDRRLKPEDRDALLAWVDQGCPPGDPKDAPPPREFPTEWRLGKPDMVLTMPQEFAVPATAPKNGIPYKFFRVDPGFKEDRWIAAAEARPGAPSVVHHIVIFILPPGKRFNPEDPANLVLCGTAPGDMPMILRPGLAKKIPAGSKLVFEMHYTPNGTAQNDRSSLGLVFAKGPVQEVFTVPIFQALFRIPPGADNYQVESSFTFRRDARVIAFMPHMHLRGKDFRYEAVYPDGKKTTLLSVPRYNFYWQSAYLLSEPLAAPKGSKIHCIAHFDNSAKNPNNPDPTKAVYWGDQTWEEMMIGWMDYVNEPGK